MKKLYMCIYKGWSGIEKHRTKKEKQNAHLLGLRVIFFF